MNVIYTFLTDKLLKGAYDNCIGMPTIKANGETTQPGCAHVYNVSTFLKYNNYCETPLYPVHSMHAVLQCITIDNKIAFKIPSSMFVCPIIDRVIQRDNHSFRLLKYCIRKINRFFWRCTLCTVHIDHNIPNACLCRSTCSHKLRSPISAKPTSDNYRCRI